MNSEEVKEIKEKLKEEIFIANSFGDKWRKVPTQELEKILTLVNELESENERLKDEVKARQGFIYSAKEFTESERSAIALSNNYLTFLKMCIYFMRDKLKADNKRYEETLFGLSYCTTPEPEKSVYENMINMNEKTITQCSEWLKRLEDVQDR